jgi:hypothetical protein
MKTYRLDDMVIARIAQVLQEALVTGVDIVDLLRGMELTEDSAGDKMVLTETYVEKINAEYERLAEMAKELQSKESPD